MLRMRFAARTSAELGVWTGLSGAQFLPLIKKLRHVRADKRRGHPWGPAFADRVLLLVLSYRTSLTLRQLGSLLATFDSAAHRMVKDLAPHLSKLLGPPPKDKRELWIADGTLISVYDQKRTKKSKNYRRGVNVQVIVRDRCVIAVGDAWPATGTTRRLPRNPAKDPVAAGYPRLFRRWRLLGLCPDPVPARGPDGRIIRDWTYKRFRRRRAVVEHVLARLKDYQILRQCRREGDAINDAVRGVAALHNLKIDVP
ncbi:hypothetical protein, partial [Acrocarpospora sp. B8E8]|uniref:hypothetical protein n=1 Tax=Acrocarpospora sp. B8E8 TaxID=3153572 RepID=UPI00325E10A2